MIKRNVLWKKTKPIEIKKQKISDLAENLSLTGFQARKLGEAIKIWQKILKEKEITIWLGISGAIVPAGMRKIISFLIKNRFVDAVVSTGAQLFHEIFETLNKKHYLGESQVNDYQLFKKGIVRIYDIFAREIDLLAGEFFIKRVASRYLKENKIYSSREIHWLLGRELQKISKDKDSILINAYQSGVPIFTPAFGNSYIGIAIWYAALSEKKTFIVDSIKDLSESAYLTFNSKKTGVIYLGGGEPKNYIQQTAEITPDLADPEYIKSQKPISEKEGLRKPHSYTIQITTDTPHYGGLSGCTFEEAQSWGKVARDAKKVQCFCDITIALPFIAQTLFEKSLKDAKKRKKPFFDWSKEPVEIKYK